MRTGQLWTVLTSGRRIYVLLSILGFCAIAHLIFSILSFGIATPKFSGSLTICDGYRGFFIKLLRLSGLTFFPLTLSGLDYLEDSLLMKNDGVELSQLLPLGVLATQDGFARKLQGLIERAALYNIKTHRYQCSWEKITDDSAILKTETRTRTCHISLSFPKCSGQAVIAIFHKRNEYLWNGELSGLKSASAFQVFSLKPMGNASFLGIPDSVAWYRSQIPHSSYMECDIRAANAYRSKFTPTERKNIIKKAQYTHSVHKFMEFTRSLGLRVWMSSGTLLGWYRECGLVPHTTDLDFAAEIPDSVQKVIDSFTAKNSPIKPKYRFGTPSDGFELSLTVPPHKVKIDMFFVYSNRTHYWTSGLNVLSKFRKFRYTYPKSMIHFYPLCTAELLGVLLPAPCSPRQFVLRHYGTSWNSPVKKFDFDRSPSNLEFVGTVPKGEQKLYFHEYK